MMWKARSLTLAQGGFGFRRRGTSTGTGTGCAVSIKRSSAHLCVVWLHSVKVSHFEHVEGCTVCKGLYKHYTYPNGKTVHLYQTDELYELLVDTTVQVCAL